MIVIGYYQETNLVSKSKQKDHIMEKHDLLCEWSQAVASGEFFEGECLGSTDTSIKQRAKKEKAINKICILSEKKRPRNN